MRTAPLFQRFYLSNPGYIGGTAEFHQLVRNFSAKDCRFLEVGAGPSNPTSDYLASLGTVFGLDLDDAVLKNGAVAEAKVFGGGIFPFSDDSFRTCVSNYVLEHVLDCETHFREVARVLEPGGRYVFRTPNIWHYVTLASRFLPHSAHLRIANRVRALPQEAHAPYPTVYRANSRTALKRLARKAGLRILLLRMIEPEPSYGAAHPVLFFPMMAYERLVNSSSLFESFRVNIIGVLEKPSLNAEKKFFHNAPSQSQKGLFYLFSSEYKTYKKRCKTQNMR